MKDEKGAHKQMTAKRSLLRSPNERKRNGINITLKHNVSPNNT
ncbi:hypothetical protein [Shewanella sp.]